MPTKWKLTALLNLARIDCIEFASSFRWNETWMKVYHSSSNRNASEANANEDITSPIQLYHLKKWNNPAHKLLQCASSCCWHFCFKCFFSTSTTLLGIPFRWDLPNQSKIRTHNIHLIWCHWLIFRLLFDNKCDIPSTSRDIMYWIHWKINWWNFIPSSIRWKLCRTNVLIEWFSMLFALWMNQSQEQLRSICESWFVYFM